MKIDEIISFPTIINNNHESLYRSFHVMNKIIEMVNRGDSKETINEVYEFLKTKTLTLPPL